MGEIADSMINGFLCQECGVFIDGDEPGHPRSCYDCVRGSVDIIVSTHACKRAKERLSLNKKALKRMAKIAFTDGITHAETTGRLKRFISKKYLNNRHSNNIRVYGEVIFFFSDNKLITLYQLPTKVRKIANKKQKS